MDRYIPQNEICRRRIFYILKIAAAAVFVIFGAAVTVDLLQSRVKRSSLNICTVDSGVIEASGNLVKRKVNLGECDFGHVEVIDGLLPGDKVVVSDMSAYKNTLTLKIK